MNSLRWYRQLRGGIWIKYFDKHVNNGLEFWKRYMFASDAAVDVKHYEYSGVKVIAYEVYQKQLSNTAVNLFIKLQKNVWGTDADKIISDGYHTFSELYEHKNKLFITLLNMLGNGDFHVWKSHRHSDNEQCEAGWFIAGFSDKLSYHLPIEYWDYVKVPIEERAFWNGSTSQEQAKSILSLFEYGYYRTYIEIDHDRISDMNLKKGDRIIHNMQLFKGTVKKQRGTSVYFHKDGDPEDKTSCTTIRFIDKIEN